MLDSGREGTLNTFAREIIGDQCDGSQFGRFVIKRKCNILGIHIAEMRTMDRNRVDISKMTDGDLDSMNLGKYLYQMYLNIYF